VIFLPSDEWRLEEFLNIFKTRRLGCTEYSEAYKLQTELVQSRLEGTIPDTLLLLEHEAVITVGKSGRPENILAPRSVLEKEGIPLFFVDRGGDVTYHGPGQVVAYPIMDLKNRNRDLHQYVFDLEEVVIETLNDFSIKGQRDENHPWVWVNNGEIAAIGLSVKNWISMHGVSINVNPDLQHFALINPCGFSDRKATSMVKVVNEQIAPDEVVSCFVRHFSEVFGVEEEKDVNKLSRALA
jgi:lipoate-protein ligase B